MLDCQKLWKKWIGYSPIVTSEQELFEAFMYHDPKNGTTFKRIIDDWVIKNVDAYQTAKEKIENALTEASKQLTEPTPESVEVAPDHKDFLGQFQPYEEFFVKAAIKANPYFLNIEEVVHGFYEDLQKLLAEDEEMADYPNFVLSTVDSQSDFHTKIMRKFKQRRMYVSAHVDFEKWVRQETDNSVLFHLYLLLGLKVYQQRQAYARYRILHEPKYWDAWREGAAFGVEVKDYE